jgi:cytochrome c
MKQAQTVRPTCGGLGRWIVFPGLLAFFLYLGIATAQTNGKQAFQKRCAGCHALDRDKEGPNLKGVYGRPAASVESFEYSSALRKSKLTWTRETLDKWLTDPDKLVPNNDMTFSVPDSAERSEIIAYLKEISQK